MSYEEAMQSRATAKMKVADLVTQEVVPVMFNPTEWEHGVRVNWHRFQIPGLSHQPKHYIGTENAKFSMELFYRATTLAELNEMDDKMRFFESLGYPVEADDVASGGPPRALFVWPKVASLVVTLNDLTTNFIMFTREGRPRVARVRVEIEEIRSIRLLSSTVRRDGLRRASSQRVLTADPFK
jgi:hypothetical protein